MNHTLRFTLSFILLTLFIAGILLPAPALALKVEGARIALDVEPGKTYTSPIGISINPEESGGTFAIDVMGFGQSPADGTSISLDAVADTSPYTARPFITIDRPTVTLEPGGRADVTAIITVPAGAKDGGRYAIILVHPAASASGAPAAFATAVAIPVVLTVKGGSITETGEILALEPPIAEVGTPFEVITTFQNSGNYHYYDAENSVTITDTSGKVIATAGTEPFSRAIVPGNSVEFSCTIKNGLPQGTYQLTSRVEKQDGKMLVEKKATLQVGNPMPLQATADTKRNPVPGFGALIAVMGIAFALFGALRIRKRGDG